MIVRSRHRNVRKLISRVLRCHRALGFFVVREFHDRLEQKADGILQCAVALTVSVGSDGSVMCYYEILTGTYDYLTACDVDAGAERYEIYKRLHTALKDFVNSNGPADKIRIYSEYEENRRERARLTAKMDKCQGQNRQNSESLFKARTTEEFATQLLDRLSHPEGPYKGDCL